MPIRMKDIAKDLNVAVSTVSKVLRNQGRVSAATRKRVLRRAEEMNYRMNWVARSLSTRRTYTIGVMVPDLIYSFFAEIAKAVAHAVRPHGFHVIISDSEENADVEAHEIETLLARQVDGLIIASAQPPGRTDAFDRIREYKTPLVLIDRWLPGLLAPFVGVDDKAIGRLATEHLIKQGCRRIAHLSGPDIGTGRGRREGYRRALAKHHLPAPAEYVVAGSHDADTGYAAMRQLLKRPTRPDGVFCFNDGVAMGAINAILEAGLGVPEALAVVGVGNVHTSEFLRVSLTTIDQNSAEIGRKAAEILLERIEAKRPGRPKRVLIPPKLLIRSSSIRSEHHGKI